MTDAVQLALAAILSLSGGHGPVGIGTHELAVLVAQEAICHEVDPEVVVAVMSRESSFEVAAESGAGDHGLMQIRRGRATRGYRLRGERAIHAPATNVHLGVRRLAMARGDCPGSAPVAWLGGYAGVAGCVPTRYGRRVLRERERIRS